MVAIKQYEWTGTDVDITSVERHLSSLWQALSREHEYASPVRTHHYNLVVFAGDRSEALALTSNLEVLDLRQPSRTITLIADRWHTDSGIDAEVALLCAPDAAGRSPRCYERIVVTARGRAADHLDSVVVPLLTAELPTFLWWPGQPPFGYRMFHRVLAVADHLVVDSASFSSPGDGMADLAHVCSGRQSINDFNWARLAPWREIIAQFFDGPQLAPYAGGINQVNLQFGAGEGNSGQATAGLLLLLGWVAHAFNWEPETTLEGLLTRDVELSVLQEGRLIPIRIRFADHGARAAGKLMRLELHGGLPGHPAAEFVVVRSPDLIRAEVSVQLGSEPPLTRVLPLQVKTDAELLADELEMAAHDHLYETVVERASRLAGREVWVPA